MTLLKIDLSDVLDGYHDDDAVVVWAPHHREGSRGQVVNTAQKQIKLDKGKADQEVEPGPLMVKIQCRGLSDTAPKEVIVPDQADVPLWDLLEQDFTYTPPIISEVSEARAEVREAVARVGSAEQVGEWAERSETAASDALIIKNSIPATVQSEVDTRVSPAVSDAVTGMDLMERSTAEGLIQESVAGIGSEFINIDTDGTPYWVELGGTHYLLTDSAGPYYTSTLARKITQDSDGTPVIS